MRDEGLPRQNRELWRKSGGRQVSSEQTYVYSRDVTSGHC